MTPSIPPVQFIDHPSEGIPGKVDPKDSVSIGEKEKGTIVPIDQYFSAEKYGFYGSPQLRARILGSWPQDFSQETQLVVLRQNALYQVKNAVPGETPFSPKLRKAILEGEVTGVDDLRKAKAICFQSVDVAAMKVRREILRFFRRNPEWGVEDILAFNQSFGGDSVAIESLYNTKKFPDKKEHWGSLTLYLPTKVAADLLEKPLFE